MNRGMEERYKSFISKCKRVADAYGITLEQYVNVTLNRNVIDFDANVEFNQIFEWQDRHIFHGMYEEEKNNEPP